MHRNLYITKCEDRPYSFVPPPVSDAYALLIAVTANDITAEEQSVISDMIIASGARYVAAWGHKCSAWDDSIDQAYIETDPNFSPPDDRFVMTTWHENETIEDAFEFLWMCGTIDDKYPVSVCAFIIGAAETIEQRILKHAENLGIAKSK